MRRMILAALRGHAGRYVAGGLAIMLGVAFVATALMVLSSAQAAMAQAAGAQYARADLVVTGSAEPITPAAVDRLGRLDGVAGVAGLAASGARVTFPGSSRPAAVGVSGLPADPSFRWHRVDAGRLPSGPSEAAVPRDLARDRDLKVGSVLRVHPEKGPARAVRVVGVVSGGTLLDSSSLVADDRAIAAWSGEVTYGEVLVRAASGADRSAVTDRLRKDLAGATVQTAEQRTDDQVRSFTNGVDVLGGFLLGFAGIAVFVATLVVANTFTILLAQRTRELALLRCVGALRRQIFGSVVAESLLLGLAASIAGLGVGTGLAGLAVILLGRSPLGIPTGGLVVTPAGILVPLVVGLVTTVLAALAPARRATRVSPLAALRPELAAGARSRAGIVRTTLAVLCVLAGAATLFGAMTLTGFLAALALGIGGGLLSFVGILLGAPLLVPALVRLLGGLTGRLGGPPARLAVGNAVRNPRRTAATAAALLVGVTLIAMMSVGAASVQKSFHASLDSRYPLDLSVDVQTGALPDAVVKGVPRVEGISRTATLTSAQVRLAAAARSASGRPIETTVLAVDPSAAHSVLRNPKLLDGLGDRTAIMGPSTASSIGVHHGDRIVLGSGKSRVDLRAQVVRSDALPQVLVSSADLARVAPKAPVSAVWARVADTADGTQVVSRAQEIVGNDDTIHLGGAAPERAVYDKVLNILLLVATGLLAVAVVIALVGVGNTLSLSVLERTREQAMLRALGLTRGQLRAMLAGEALLIAAAAVVAGLVLGTAYGFAGTRILLGEVTSHIELGVPVARLVLVAAVALAAGLAASVLPARRAVRVPPAAAIGTE
ncbi:FtsX-like permease family protein [Actinopolymorpha singaporensis]|uniref:Putative ABC transport system permease protein n=1 Tax=Actinopolymorpha singaporensis TaxID=117157 RepID=A0A1H1QJV8_9ACTN|nr:ABC transporter permease [Actinopolymorpha singaporensis]SDS23758.1 putative ABC transport system permease protein [Actinopolymorpha singaporensis]